MKLRNIYWILFSIMVLIVGCNNEDPAPNPEEEEEEEEEVVFNIDIGDSKIPYIMIDTDGAQIQNEPKIPATMKIFVEKNLVQEQTIGIEYRGSTSFRISDKKSYGIETWDEAGEDVDVSFFGFPKEEDWVLIGHVVNVENKYIFDRTLLYHYLGYNWSRSIGRYTSRMQLVELQLNGVYQGVYLFGEKLKRDGDRIAIERLDAGDADQTGGFI